MASSKKSKKFKKKKPLRTVFIILASLFLSAYVLMALAEDFNFKYIPSLQEFKEFVFKDSALNDKTGDFEVHFIDVGQGDCSLIISDSQTILIDAGENNKGTVVVDYLKKLGVKKIDMIIATHPHSDHIGGLDTVIDSFEIGKIVMPKIPDKLVPTTRSYTDVLTSIANKGLKITPAKVGDVYEFGKGQLEILGPVAEFDDLNNISVISKFTYNDKSFLFTGDVESPAEKVMLEKKSNISADVLKVAHHGSSSSTSKQFLIGVNPKYCVIQVGDKNDYNHPSKKTLETFKITSAKVLRNDFQGSIVFKYVDGELKVTSDK